MTFLKSDLEAPFKEIRQYRPDIDGLKAIAVLSVIVFHYASSLVPGGFIGVDLFFVVSGYLIGRSTFVEIQRGAYSVAKYFGRRAKRIFPSLIVLLLCLWIVGWFILLPDEFSSLGKHIGAASIFISNWLLWREIGYFDVSADLKPLLNLWSLGVEEQFYLIFPLVIWGALKFGRQVFWSLLLLAVGSLWLSESRVLTHAGWAYYHPVSRIWELLAGALLAYTELHRVYRHGDSLVGRLAKRIAPWRQHAISMVGLCCVAMGLFLYSKETAFPGLKALLPVTGAICIIAAGPTAWVNQKLLTWRPLIYIGLISYPLYLWHWPLIAVARLVDGSEPPLWLKVILLSITFGASIACYHFIERPIRFGALAKKQFMALALWGLLLLIGALGFATYKQHGFAKHFSTQNPMPMATQDAASKPLPPIVSKAILIGDSHAGVIKTTLESYLRAQGISLTVHDQGGCAPFINLDRHDPGHEPQGCPKVINQGIQKAIDDPEVSTIIIAGRLDTLNHLFDSTRPETDTASNQKNDDRQRNYALLETAVMQTLAQFDRKNKRVILIETVPSLNFDPALCRKRPVRFAAERKEPCMVDRQTVMNQQREFRDIFETARARYPFITLVDPMPALCDDQYCYATKDGVLLYGDDSHLTPAGVSLVSKQFKF